MFSMIFFDAETFITVDFHLIKNQIRINWAMDAGSILQFMGFMKSLANMFIILCHTYLYVCMYVCTLFKVHIRANECVVA